MVDDKAGMNLQLPEAYVWPNPFVQKVREDFGPPSPIAVVKDDFQPAKGCLRSLRKDRDETRHVSASQIIPGPSRADILRGKELENESLSPSLRKDVELDLRANGLLARRVRFTL